MKTARGIAKAKRKPSLGLPELAQPLTQCQAQNNQTEDGTREQSVTTAVEDEELFPLHDDLELPRLQQTGQES